MELKNCAEVRDFIKQNTDYRNVFIESWEGTVQPPYIVVSEGDMQTIFADDRNYVKKRRFYITVFTKKTDSAPADCMEELLESNDICYLSDRGWLNDLRLKWYEYEI